VLIFIPEIPHSVMARICRRFRFRFPRNVHFPVDRWHYGWYYGYGHATSWIPIGKYGGIATHAFRGHTVTFPPKLAALLSDLMHDEREALKAKPRYRMKGMLPAPSSSSTGTEEK